MKNSRLRRYLQQKAVSKSSALVNKQEIQNNPDKHIDQDFEGYPHGPAKEEIINPKTRDQQKSAAINTKDGEKMIESENKRKVELEKEEVDNGSAGAFEGTETVAED